MSKYYFSKLYSTPAGDLDLLEEDIKDLPKNLLLIGNKFQLKFLSLKLCPFGQEKKYSRFLLLFVILVKIMSISFIFQGSKNWDMYFAYKTKNKDVELSIYENVILHVFDIKEEQKFLDFLKNNKIIDYSIEHKTEKDINKFFVLVDDE